MSENWDIALIFFIGTLYAAIAGFARGAVYENAAIRFGKWSVPIILITIVAVSYYQGQIHSAVDLVVVVLSALVGLSVFGLVMCNLPKKSLRIYLTCDIIALRNDWEMTAQVP